jgi:Alginate lyase
VRDQRVALLVGLAPLLLAASAPACAQLITRVELIDIESARVLATADRYLLEPPITITAFPAARSAGGVHDFYSEGDYWWPDPKDPGAPYVRRDGQTNPDNFVAHRDAMRRLSLIVPALTAAYQITRDERYARHAVAHLRAWFVDTATAMNPSLLYAQAIKGHVTGRDVGIIDTIHLVEVAQAVIVLREAGYLKDEPLAPIMNWFQHYVTWLTTHPYGIDERNATNNHSTAWVLQVGAFAKLAGDQQALAAARRLFKEKLVPEQIATDGSFPRELERTKPYGYALFNLDVMAMAAEILSTPDENLWTFTTADGRGLARALAFMYPYIKDKATWTRPPDVMYFDAWPIRHPALLFGGRALREPRYLALWQTLEPDPTEDEVIRNYPVRQPLLWLH